MDKNYRAREIAYEIAEYEDASVTTDLVDGWSDENVHQWIENWGWNWIENWGWNYEGGQWVNAGFTPLDDSPAIDTLNLKKSQPGGINMDTLSVAISISKNESTVHRFLIEVEGSDLNEEETVEEFRAIVGNWQKSWLRFPGTKVSVKTIGPEG